MHTQVLSVPLSLFLKIHLEAMFPMPGVRKACPNLSRVSFASSFSTISRSFFAPAALDCKNGKKRFKTSTCDHHACLSSWETRIQSFVRPLLKILKYLRSFSHLYIDISKWLDFRVFSDKDVKSQVPRIIIIIHLI